MGFVQPSHAAVIAIVDSGTDVQHPEISKKIWTNPGEQDDAVDNDDNGYVDDLFGWNFVDNNNKLVDRKLIGTFSPDVYKYFEIQTKALNGTATAEEKAWIKAKIQDENYIAQLQSFGNFVHGTHVAGISAKDAAQAKLLILKTIGTPTPTFELFSQYMREHSLDAASGISGIKDKLIYAGLDYLAKAQGQALDGPGKYLEAQKPRVANCSFGASREAVKPMLKKLIEAITQSTLTDDQINTYVDYFVNKTAEAMDASFIAPSRDTLFVIAAGNDGSDNDTVPAAPANIKSDHTISVAATLGRTRLASFSNYGETMVDIAAPGVGILSSTPGNEHVMLSGTSQAAPYITNIAGRIMDANPSLSAADVKLILMETVDKKDFLVKKVRSEGIANPDRAVVAAKLSTTMSLTAAIEKAKRQVGAIQSTLSEGRIDESMTFVVPLQSLLK
jgi:subtilisin family serine protease